MKLLKTILSKMQHVIRVAMDWTIKHTKIITVSVSVYWLLLQLYRLYVGQEHATLFEILMFCMILDLFTNNKSA
jgi:hypothetical protein